MDHDALQEKAWLLRDGELPPGERAFVQAHLEECAECRGLMMSWTDLSETLFAAPSPAETNAFVDRVMARVGVKAAPVTRRERWWSGSVWAMAAAALLMVAGWLRVDDPVSMTDVLLADESERISAVEEFSPAEWEGSDALVSVLEES